MLYLLCLCCVWLLLLSIGLGWVCLSLLQICHDIEEHEATLKLLMNQTREMRCKEEP